MPISPTVMRGVKSKRMVSDRQKTRRYNTGSTIWRRIRAAQLRREPLCKHCGDKGLLVPANTVDHIDGNAWNDCPTNHQSLCHSCHSIKTVKEDGGLGNDS